MANQLGDVGEEVLDVVDREVVKKDEMFVEKIRMGNVRYVGIMLEKEEGVGGMMAKWLG